MFNLYEVSEKQETVNTDSVSSAIVRKVSPLGSNYTRKGVITNTSAIEFALCIAHYMMQVQGVEVVPVEVILSIGKELDLPLSTAKKSARKRIKEHVEALSLAVPMSERLVHTEITTQGKGKAKKEVKVETPFTLKGYLLTTDTFNVVENVIYDFPA